MVFKQRFSILCSFLNKKAFVISFNFTYYWFLLLSLLLTFIYPRFLTPNEWSEPMLAMLLSKSRVCTIYYWSYLWSVSDSENNPVLLFILRMLGFIQIPLKLCEAIEWVGVLTSYIPSSVTKIYGLSLSEACDYVSLWLGVWSGDNTPPIFISLGGLKPVRIFFISLVFLSMAFTDFCSRSPTSMTSFLLLFFLGLGLGLADFWLTVRLECRDVALLTELIEISSSSSLFTSSIGIWKEFFLLTTLLD